MTTTMIALSMKLMGFCCHDDTSVLLRALFLSLFAKEYAPNVVVSFRDVIPERQLEHVNRFQTVKIAQQIAGAKIRGYKKIPTLTITLNLLKIKSFFAHIFIKIFVKTHFHFHFKKVLYFIFIHSKIKNIFLYANI